MDKRFYNFSSERLICISEKAQKLAWAFSCRAWKGQNKDAAYSAQENAYCATLCYAACKGYLEIGEKKEPAWAMYNAVLAACRAIWNTARSRRAVNDYCLDISFLKIKEKVFKKLIQTT